MPRRPHRVNVAFSPPAALLGTPARVLLTGPVAADPFAPGLPGNLRG